MNPERYQEGYSSVWEQNVKKLNPVCPRSLKKYKKLINQLWENQSPYRVLKSLNHDFMRYYILFKLCPKILTPKSMHEYIYYIFRSWLHDGRVGKVADRVSLSVEDIEDIYLFGTMITGLLLIGLGFALGYRRI